MAYNEQASVRTTVLEVVAELSRMHVSHEILVVDDGSTHGTAQALDDLGPDARSVRLIQHPVNQGLGAVYRTGFASARGIFLTFVPADGQLPASNIGLFLQHAQACDAVLGYYEARNDGVLASLLTRCERLLYTALIGRMPRFQGMIMIRRSILSDITLTSTGRGWGILMELVARIHRSEYRTASVATLLVGRRAGHSKVRNLRTIAANLQEVIALRRRLR